MSKPGRRRHRPPMTSGRYVPADGPVIKSRVPKYAVRWHRVDDWAEGNITGDLEPFISANKRIAGHRGVWVMDINNDEEAFERGIPLEYLDELREGPNRDRGGTRRISIRFFTWTINAGRQGAYDPQWITTGWGMAARSAAHAHGRWLDGYRNALGAGIESRRLIATAMEIVFWTAAASADYV